MKMYARAGIGLIVALPASETYSGAFLAGNQPDISAALGPTSRRSSPADRPVARSSNPPARADRRQPGTCERWRTRGASTLALRDVPVAARSARGLRAH